MAMLDRAAGQFVCDFVERLPTTDTGKPFGSTTGSATP